MSPRVDTGQEILIPLYDEEAQNKLYQINWRQDLIARHADYYLVIAANLTLSEQFPFFIAAEFYRDSTHAHPKHITKVGELIEGEGYKLRVDSKLQYGQKNADGDLRFVVYHDKERRPFQHRFIETAIGSAGAGMAQELVKAFGYSASGDQIAAFLKNFVGDYLHTF
ncbi:hypothetical protein EST38_g6026 [Candolleomyces aberdarensis]|uniref:Uncharacterized protein n=1 Tax=Candolleomyces aberdarensis TaxID=2316362 RepID=A0A4Q2DLN5_9AGAR|nr:hypothetical protein EST38_g6026 [Candolleomyces aberdarensis]